MRPAGLLRVATLALIWGSGFLWIKLSLRGFTPVELTWGRLALGAAVLLVTLAIRSIRLPTERRLWGHLAIAALLGNAIPYLLFGIAEQDVTSSLAGAINATTPLWTLAFAMLFRTQKRPSSVGALGLTLGFVGALMILAPWSAITASHLVGALLCLAASASYGASYVYIGRYLNGSGFPPIVLSAAQLLTATAWLTFALPVDRSASAPKWDSTAVVGLLILGLVGTGMAYILNYRIIADDGPLLASTVTYLLPVVAVLLGVVILGETVDSTVVAGVGVVLLGVGLARTQRHRADAPR